MSAHEDEAVRGALRTMAVAQPVGDAPIDTLLRRGHRARARRVAVIGAAAGLGVAAVASAVAVVASPSPPPRAPQIPLATTPASFHIKITMAAYQTSGHLTATGAFDPATRDGYLTQLESNGRVGPVAQIEVGGLCYEPGPWPVGGHLEWRRLSWGCFTFGEETGTISDSGPAADPDGLLRQLAASGDAKLVGTQGGGDHEMQNWAYSYVSYRGPNGVGRFTGTMTVDVTQKHVIRLTMAPQGPGSASRDTEENIYEFSDFGAPVRVSAPSPVVNPTPSS
jgi:hypothetical protein